MDDTVKTFLISEGPKPFFVHKKIMEIYYNAQFEFCL